MDIKPIRPHNIPTADIQETGEHYMQMCVERNISELSPSGPNHVFPGFHDNRIDLSTIPESMAEPSSAAAAHSDDQGQGCTNNKPEVDDSDYSTAQKQDGHRHQRISSNASSSSGIGSKGSTESVSGEFTYYMYSN